MTIKQFLKPTLLKIILTIVLFVLAHAIQLIFRMGVMDYWIRGVPLVFERSWGPCLPDMVCHSFNWLFLIVDIIFWYLVAALVYIGIKRSIIMRKILKIILIVFVVLVILILGFLGYTYLKQEYEILKLPDYYRDLAKHCRKSGSFGCCMTSVRAMARGNYKLAPETGCPEGFKPNMFRCIASYKWCEPMLELACEADFDCVFYYTKLSQDDPCDPCFYASDEVICMNKTEREKRFEEVFGAPYRIVFCEQCFENDYDLYHCKCVNNTCQKLLK